MPKITSAGASTSPTDAHVRETDDPTVRAELDARESRAHAAENVMLRRQVADLQRQLGEATLAAAEPTSEPTSEPVDEPAPIEPDPFGDDR